MSTKLLLAFTAALSVALAGCGDTLAALAGNVQRNNDIGDYNQQLTAAEVLNDRRVETGNHALTLLRTARSNPTSSTIAAASEANAEFLRAARAALVAEERLLRLGLSIGVPAQNTANSRRNIAAAEQDIESARRFNAELNNLQARIGGGSGGSGSGGSGGSRLALSDVDYMVIPEYAYSNDNGNIERSSIERRDSITAGFAGRTFSASSVYIGYYERIDNYVGRGTYNGIPAYLRLFRIGDSSGDIVRQLAMVGRHSHARTIGAWRNGTNDSYSVYSAAIMHDTFDGPSLSATFRGGMIGTELLSSAALAGESRVTYSRSSDAVDVRLFNIRHIDDSTDYDTPYRGPTEFTWSDLDQGAGFFSGYNSDRHLKGNFAGPNAEEVAGVFEAPISGGGVVVGGFVAKR